METKLSFESLDQVATRFGVPSNWLRAEAIAGRIPCLKAGRRMLFNAAAVETELAARAGHSNEHKCRGNDVH